MESSFLIRFKVICMFSVLYTGMLNCNVPVKALFRLSDELKCSDLSNSKVKEKSCVREQIFVGFCNVVNQTQSLTYSAYFECH